ncbi:MAG: PDZ domain-containing protein [Akkermansiaceae bacterium]|nr:PDZ domain-containing protein [Akkermansiaceae bacterium]
MAHAPLSAQYSLEAPKRSTGSELLAVFEPQRQVLQSSSALIMDGRDESGYGVVISPEGHILTKASEFTRLKKPLVVVDKKRYKEVKLLGIDKQWDVCLIKIDAKDLKPVEYAESSELALGSWVVTNGATSRFRRRLLMGVISAKPHRIPPAGGLMLGLTLKKEDAGLVVQKVTANSGAKDAGLKQKDVVLTANGKSVKEVKELLEIIEQLHTGSRVELGIKRGDEDMSFEVELAPKEQLMPKPSRNDMMSGDFSTRRSDFPRVVQHSILGNSKSVGGPLLNLEGQCVGMNIARANRAESFAIPCEELQKIAARLMAGEGAAEQPPKAPDETAEKSLRVVIPDQ